MYHHDSRKAASSEAKKAVKGSSHVLRHKITRGMSMSAISNMILSSLLWCISDLIEIADAHSTDIMLEYDRARMRNAITSAETIAMTDVHNQVIVSTEGAKAWLSEFIPKHDDTLLKSIFTMRLKTEREEHLEIDKNEKKEDRKEEKDRKGEDRKKDHSRSLSRGPQATI